MDSRLISINFIKVNGRANCLRTPIGFCLPMTEEIFYDNGKIKVKQETQGRASWKCHCHDDWHPFTLEVGIEVKIVCYKCKAEGVVAGQPFIGDAEELGI